MENGRRGRSASRASTTSSSPEVRCACQYYRSDSLLPERSALAAVRPAPRQTALRMVQTPPAGRRQPVRCGDHDYEPIGQPALRMAVSQHSISSRSLAAPVVKITDTDMAPVADSDDSIEDRYRFKERAHVLEGDVVLPLDGCIEDHAMQSRNLGDGTNDNSADEIEIAGPDPVAAPPGILKASGQCSSTAAAASGQIQNDNQVEVTEKSGEGGGGFQERFKNQADKIRSKLQNIQKPSFAMPQSRSKRTEATLRSSGDGDASPTTARVTQKASSMERFRMALPERRWFALPDKSKFHLPDKSRFHLPDRSRFHLPDKSRFHLPNKSRFHLPDKSRFTLPDKSKFHIKKPNIQLPKSLTRPRRTASERIPQKTRDDNQTSNEDGSTSTIRNIFDFSTYPRPKLFERKSKTKVDQVASSPKESRSAEVSTFPRTKKSSMSLSERWNQRFGNTSRFFHDSSSIADENIIDRSKPWMHPSFEKPRLSLKPQTSRDDNEDDDEKYEEEDEDEDDEREEEDEDEEDEEDNKLPWENTERRIFDPEDDLPLDDVEEKNILFVDDVADKKEDFVFGKEIIKDPRVSDEELMNRIGKDVQPKKKVRMLDRANATNADPRAVDEASYYRGDEEEEEAEEIEEDGLDNGFPPVDPRNFNKDRGNSEGASEDEDSSIRSDREVQQSSESSCERRRHGVIEEIDSDEFFLREKGISQENMRFRLISEIRDALRPGNALADEIPPQRPKRTRSLRKRKEESIDSYEAMAQPDRPKRERGCLRRSQESFDQSSLDQFDHLDHFDDLDDIEHLEHLDRLNDQARHRVVYRTDAPPQKLADYELGSGDLDNIVVLKPERRKHAMKSQSHTDLPVDDHGIILEPRLHQEPPVVPRRRKRLRRERSSDLSLRTIDGALCNGYGEEGRAFDRSAEMIPPMPPPTPPPDFPIDDETESFQEQDSALPPMPPKRTRSVSRTASLPPEDDRTSHGADSLSNDFGYVEDDLPTIPRDSSSREASLPGYAVIEKKEKPPRPPPPRRKRQLKYATAPRPSKKVPPTRPLRTYSTLKLAKSVSSRKSIESMPFIDHDYSLDQEDELHKGLLSGEVVVKVQGRPLPAPPRPPRHRKVHGSSTRREITPDVSETVASTQTDPLPDDLVIEEEVTSAKLVVTPPRAGSREGSTRVYISTERIPSPTGGNYGSTRSLTTLMPLIPPLPGSLQQKYTEDHLAQRAGSQQQTVASPGDPRRLDPSQLDMLRAALFSTEEPLRIPSLEVADLKVDRLTVSQIEAYKVAASEIDAIVVSTTEMSNKNGTNVTGVHPSLIQELISIRNQLEAVTASQSPTRPQSVMEDQRRDLRESSPLLMVQSPSDEHGESTGEMGRTVFPAPMAPVADDTETAPSHTQISDEPMSVAIEEGEGYQRMEPRSRSRSRSRSPSPSPSIPGAVRQTASPVKSLPPVISVTPDSIVTRASTEVTSNNNNNNNNNMPIKHVTSNEVQPQRAVISYSSIHSDEKTSSPHKPPRQSSPQSSEAQAKLIALQTSQIPPEFFRLVNPSLLSPAINNALLLQQHQQQQQQQQNAVDVEPGVADTIGQLFRVLRLAGSRSLRHFVDSIVSRFDGQSGAAGEEEKIRRIEFAMCALMVLIAGLIIFCICSPRSVTHHHHWDYFNPPK